ncbi:MAG: hypothetical protein IPM08_11165 [Actinomycetales bacterium]|nr:hypothetical protein [Actinomycetales bacterium]
MTAADGESESAPRPDARQDLAQGQAHESGETLFAARVPDPPRTGDPVVDKALADFAVAMCGDISAHPDAGTAVELALQSRLHDLSPE